MSYELILPDQLASRCCLYRNGGAFHNLRDVTSKTKSFGVAFTNVKIHDVDNVRENKIKIGITLANDDDLKALHHFEESIKMDMLNTKVGNLFMSEDIMRSFQSAICMEGRHLETTLLPDDCVSFYHTTNGEVSECATKTALRKGQCLDYIIVEPYKLWVLDNICSITYRIKNLAFAKNTNFERRTYAFESDDD